MKELFEAIETRIKSPVMGYFTLAFLIFNWKEIYFLLADNGSAINRIDYFIENTTIESMLYFPALSAAIYALTYPWLNLLFLYLCQIPTDLKNIIQAKSEHKMLTEKNRLEQLRSEVLANTERAMIEQAKRDLEIEAIDNKELKETVKSNIQALRNENSDIESADIRNLDDPEKLLKIADSYRKRSESGYILDRQKWHARAQELEEKAHKIISGSFDP